MQDQTIYFQTATLGKCLVSLPNGFDVKRKYPLIIGLHGGGSNPERLINMWDSLSDRNFIYAVPQGPYAWLVDDQLRYDWALYPSGDVLLIDEATLLTETSIINLVSHLDGQFNISAVDLLGFSQGAIMAYTVGIRNPELFAGLISFSGPGLLAPLDSPFTGEFNANWLTEAEIRAAKNLRVFIAHGLKDQMVDYKLGIRSKDLLTKYGYEVTFCDFDGEHELPSNEILVQVIDWIKV